MDWKLYFYDILGLRLRQARRSAGLTQTQVGEMLGKPRSYVSELSKVSAYFEQDVIDTLKTTVRIDESIIWGCNHLLFSASS